MKNSYLIIIGLTISLFINAQEDIYQLGGGIAFDHGVLTDDTIGKVLNFNSCELNGVYYTFYRATMSKGLQNFSPYNPIDETTIFLSSDTIAFAWAQLVKNL